MLSRLTANAWLAGVALTCLSLGAHAAGDPAKGEMKFYTCYGCHGIPNYRNAYPDYSVPKLRHQNGEYLTRALHEYRDGTRPHATMHAQAASLSDEDIEDIAAYLQGAPSAKPAAAAAPSKVPKQVAPCVACHGENGLGVEALTPKPPVLAGQHVDYLEQALTSYHNGRRQDAIMDSMAQMLTTEEDIKIVAAYFASQPSQLATASAASK
jgi:cytochrome c553